MKKVIAVACTVVIAGIECGAPLSALAQQKTVTNTVKANSGSPAVINNNPNSQLGNYMPDKSKGGETIIKELEKLTEMAQTPQSMEKIQELEKKGEKFFEQHLISQALVSWQEMYGMSLEMKYAEGQGKALTNMCRCYVEQGQWIKAKYLGENAVEVLAGVQDQQSLARARVALAQAYFGLDNPVWATQQLDAALKVLTTSGLTNPTEAARVMYLCANLCLQFGKPKEATRFFQEGATYSAQSGDINKAVQVRIATVTSMIEMGWFTAALEEANKLLSLARANPKSGALYLVPSLQTLANAQYAANDYASARKTYEQAYALLPKVDARAVTDIARANMDQGYAYCLISTGDLEQARTFLLKALPVFKAKQDAYNQAQASNALGVLEVLDGQPAKGMPYFLQALDLQAVVSPKTPKLHATILQNIGAAEYRTGQFRDCKSHLEGALNILANTKEQQFKGRLWQSLAEAALKGADLTSAEGYITKAITIAERINDDGCLWRCYLVRAKLQLARQELDLAKESLKSAVSYFRSPQAGDFPMADGLSFPTSREDMGTILVQMMASQGMTEQALLAAEQLKEENFINEWLKRGGQVKPEDRDVYLELTSQRGRIHAAELTASPDKLVKEWQSWMERFRSVVTANRSLARLIAPVPNSPADIIAAVQRTKATAVEYLVGPESTMVFTIDPQGRISSTNLPVNRARLKSQVAALLEAGTKNGAEETASEKPTLKNLYNQLLPATVRRFLPTTADQMIVFIPDGPLYNLPFAALVDENGKFFVESHLLSMASSMSVIMDCPPEYTADLNMLVASSTSGGSEQSETDQITSAVGAERVTTLLGKDASLTNIEEQSKGKSVVHFATKLPLIENNPLRSVLPIFGDKDDNGRKVTADRLCGTPMAVDLIVWSASSVNSKDVRGNAVKMFSRGLNYAGARNVLMSLWWQPDAQRIDELVSVFKSKQAGQGPAQSLRKAQLAAISRDPSLKNWAGFQLLGPGY
jgi:CHAT domain-containing protein